MRVQLRWRSWALGAAGGALVLSGCATPGDASRPGADFQTARGLRPPPALASGPPPAPEPFGGPVKPAGYVPPTPAEPSRPQYLPIDLPTALELAAGQNPQVAFARERIQEAQTQWLATRALWIPSLRMGANYNQHDGRIQDVAGTMIETRRSSVYTGLGAQAVGAGSPAVPGLVVNTHLRDAIFQPRIAGQTLHARQQASRAATNDAVLDTALAYTDLLEALQIRQIAWETVHRAAQLVELTAAYAETGQGTAADADRARAEYSLRRVEAERTEETARVAAIRLTRQLRLEQAFELVPQEPVLFPIELFAVDAPLPELIVAALQQRPELAESKALVGEAVERLERERFAPLVPSVLLGFSYGGNGGAIGSEIRNFGERVDFDAMAFWEVRNLGVGEHLSRREAESRVKQARWREVQVLDQVAAEVAEAHAQIASRRQQVESARTGIQAALDSYQRNADRIQAGQGLPLEVLQSLQALDQARRQYVRTVADYNRAQFRLCRALGHQA